MKRLVLLLAMIIMVFSLLADNEGTSDVAEFISKKGSLIIKEYHLVASHKSMYGPTLDMDVMLITDVTSNVTERGLRVEAREKKSYGTNTSRSLLDIDEVESLISAIDYVIGNQDAYSASNQPYIELEYSSRDSFKFGVFISEGKYTAYARVGRVGSITLFIKYDDLPRVKGYFESALIKLNQ